MDPEFVDRLGYFLLGILVGLALSKFSTIERKHSNVDSKRFKARLSALPRERAGQIALLLVVLMTLYASVVSQVSSHRTDKAAADIQELQADLKQNLDCTTQILFDAVAALNERTTFAGAQGDANIKLQENQLKFLKRFLEEPPPTGDETRAAFEKYVQQEKDFLALAELTMTKQIQNPYPTVEDLTTCLAQTNAETAEPSQ